MYDKTIGVVDTLKMFAFANQAKDAQRVEQDEQHGFAADVVAADRAMINELIEIFGYPYDADIGVNGTYPKGYDGPDIYNYNLIERTDLTDAEERCDDNLGEPKCKPETKTLLVEYPRMPCLGHYVRGLAPEAISSPQSICEPDKTQQPITLTVEYKVAVGLDAGRGRYLPESWEGASRKAWGEIQNKLWTTYDKRVAYEQAIVAYDNKVAAIDRAIQALKDRSATLANEETEMGEYKTAVQRAQTELAVAKALQIIANSEVGVS